MRLVTPVLIEQTLIMFVGLVDTWLAGRYLGEDRFLAAIGLMSYVLWLLPSMFAAAAIGATAMVSRFVGAQDRPAASKVANQALLVGIALAVVVTALVSQLGSRFVLLMQLEDEAAQLAAKYLMVLIPVIPAIMVEQVGIASLRGAGDTLSGFVVMTVVNLVNVVVSASFVCLLDGSTQFKWFGLALGTAIGHGLGATLILGMLLRGRAGLRLGFAGLRPDVNIIVRLLRVGIPGGVDVLAILCCHLWFLSIINGLGTAAAAAHGLAVRIESLAYLPGTAFQVAAATMAGQYLGAGDQRRAKRGVLMACWVGGAIMAGAGLVMFFGAQPLTQLFLGNDPNLSATAATAAGLLRLVAFTMPSLALTMILTGALRGAGDTRWPLAFTFIGFLGIRIPLAYWLSRSEIQLPGVDFLITGVYGAWCAMAVDVILRSILVVVRFFQGGWKKTRV